MFDLGWQEFMMVAIVLVLVVGPKDMPRMLRSFSRFMRRAKSMASEFTSSLESAANEADLKNIIQDAKTGEFDDIANLIGGEMDDVKKSSGLDEIEQDIKSINSDNDGKAAVKSKSSAKKAASKTAKKTTGKKAAKSSAKKASAKKATAKKAAAKKKAAPKG